MRLTSSIIFGRVAKSPPEKPLAQGAPPLRLLLDAGLVVGSDDGSGGDRGNNAPG
jgi:hypothetical protein